MIEINVHSMHTTTSTTVNSVQPITVTIPNATHASVTMIAQATQNSQDHQLQLCVVCHTQLMHWVSVVTAHVRHSVSDTRPYSAHRDQVKITLLVQFDGSWFQVSC